MEGSVWKLGTIATPIVLVFESDCLFLSCEGHSKPSLSFSTFNGMPAWDRVLRDYHYEAGTQGYLVLV